MFPTSCDLRANPASTVEMYAVAAGVANLALLGITLLVPALGAWLIARRRVRGLPFCLGAVVPLLAPLLFVFAFAVAMADF